MPFFYAVNRQAATNSTAATESTHLRFLTVSNQPQCNIFSIMGAARMTSAGGVILRVKQWTTSASTGGTSATPVKRNPNNPSASTTVFTDASSITAGSGGPSYPISIGLPATGGMGGWVAIDPDDAITLLANGGATGNADLLSISGLVSVNLDATVLFSED
ncbi:MAG TPA: hypothetical protein VEC38_15220 [Candidatus Binataceae bacterium]|nr:hypothetical protein [Candidatus Binataceae bacterium]